jgi:hypothetical protein
VPLGVSRYHSGQLFCHSRTDLNFAAYRVAVGNIAILRDFFSSPPRVPFPAGAGNFSLHHRVQNSSAAHPASYPMGTRGSFPGGKAAGA